jgi:hypothetical protein
MYCPRSGLSLFPEWKFYLERPKIERQIIYRASYHIGSNIRYTGGWCRWLKIWHCYNLVSLD